MTQPPAPSAPRPALLDLPEFMAAWPLVAVAVLTLNDMVLKARFHNALTGKLSDLAGCFFLPLWLSALLRLVTRWPLETRLRWGAAATTVLFVAISTSRLAADLVCAALLPFAQVLGITRLHIAADPTDLLALPMVWLAVTWGRKQTSTGEMT